MRDKKSFDDSQSSYLSENKLFIIFAAITFALFIALALFSYNSFKGQMSSDVVLIKADEQPYKVTPEDPGGMKVNYQDKEVFNTLVGKDGANAAPANAPANVNEQPQPLSPEEVMRKSEDAAQAANVAPANDQAPAVQASDDDTTKINTASMPETTLPGAEEKITNEGPSLPVANPAVQLAEEKANAAEANQAVAEEAEKPAANVEVKSGVINIAPKTDEAVKAEEKPKSVVNKETKGENKLSADQASKKTTAKTETKTTAGKGKFYVQLSAYSSTHSLDKGWNEIKSKFGSAITGSKMVNKIERDGKTLYRLGFGPYKQKIAATEACNKIKAKGKDCIVREL